MLRSSSSRAAPCIVSMSLFEPMTMPTRGASTSRPSSCVSTSGSSVGSGTSEIPCALPGLPSRAEGSSLSWADGSRSPPAGLAPPSSPAPVCCPLPRIARAAYLPKRLAPVGLLAQLRLQDLAAGVARQRIGAHGDVLRNLEVGDVLAHVADDLLHVHVGPRGGDDYRADLFAHHLVRNAHGGCLADTGRARERVLDLDRVHVLAAAIDHVLLAVDDVEQPIGVDAREIARVQPALDER